MFPYSVIQCYETLINRITKVTSYTYYCTPNNPHQVKATRTILSLKAGNALKQAIRWRSLSSHESTCRALQNTATVWPQVTDLIPQCGLL